MMNPMILDLIPCIAAIMALAFFNNHTRWFSYALVTLAIACELMPSTNSHFALIVCFASLIGILSNDMLRHIPATQYYYKD